MDVQVQPLISLQRGRRFSRRLATTTASCDVCCHRGRRVKIRFKDRRAPRCTDRKEPSVHRHVCLSTRSRKQKRETIMGFGRGTLLWLQGVQLPIIILLGSVLR
jgi:hypothetical protein